MSDMSQGDGWWLASDGKWYPPERAWVAKSQTEQTGPTARGNAQSEPGESEPKHSASTTVEAKAAPDRSTADEANAKPAVEGPAAAKAATKPTAATRSQTTGNHERLSEHERRFEYAVERYPIATVDDEIVASVFQIALNVMARQGWQAKSITEIPVGGGLGSDGAHARRPDTGLSKAPTGVMVVFERPVRAGMGHDDRPSQKSRRHPSQKSKKWPAGEFDRRAIFGDVVIEDVKTRKRRTFAADWPVRIGEHVTVRDRQWVVVADRSPQALGAARASRN